MSARMVRASWRALPSTALALLISTSLGAQGTQAFVNGRWFDGTTFRAMTMYAVDGRFTTQAPARIDTTLDLGDGFVVPPFGEAHNHNVESSRFEAVSRLHLTRGVFYVKNPNSLPRFTAPLADRINRPGALDVTFAGGGLTGSGGHPTAIAQRQITRGSWRADEGDGGFYWNIDSLADLDAKWPRILAGKPDFIKTYLLHSEEYDRRKTDTLYHDWRGLNPALLREIVRRAHAAALRVSTHVETAHDFHQAGVAGVDEINHLPGFRPDRMNPGAYDDVARYTITEEDAARAARQGTVVVTTAGATFEFLDEIPAGSPDAARAEAARVLLRENLRRLHRHGVRIAIGSDEYGRSADFEAMQLAKERVVDNLTLLRWWSENTAAAIFPGRRIGHLRDGYEASFLVLAGDPIQDFANTSRITLRVKQGVLLNPD